MIPPAGTATREPRDRDRATDHPSRPALSTTLVYAGVAPAAWQVVRPESPGAVASWGGSRSYACKGSEW
jgi:hypothetical protein